MTHWHGIITARGGFPWNTLEDAVARGLSERGYHTWMPREHKPTRKRPDLTVPMIRGLVFVQGDVDWHDIRKIRNYRRPLAGSDQITPARISDAQISRMQAVVGDFQRAEKVSGFRKGDRVRVRFNALADLEAVVTEIRNGRATISYEMMGKAFETRKELGELEIVA